MSQQNEENGEALHSQEVTVAPRGGSLRATIPSYAVDRYDVEEGDPIEVHTLPGGFLLVDLPEK